MLRKEEARNRRSQARTVAISTQRAHDKGRIAEEPGEGKLSSPVLEQRWAGRLTHRLSQIERVQLPGVFQAAFFGSSQLLCRAKAVCTHVSTMGRICSAGALSGGVVTVRQTIVARPRVVCVF